MIEIESVTFRNFMSYGSYDTKIPLSTLGPCLITGVNGSGKSTIVNSILYPIFGRTMHSARPGDRIVNKISGKDCLTSLRMKNGDIITRTRNMAGHNELVVERNGEQLLATLSTSANQQAQLNRLYDLDWYTFCNTSFLTQLGRTWFEMPEPQRKKEIERAMHIDRYTIRAQVAKDKLDKSVQEQTAIRQKMTLLVQQIASVEEDLQEAIEQEASFVSGKDDRFKKALEQARAYKKQFDEAVVPDVAKLKERWAAIQEARTALRGLEERLRKHQTAVVTAEARERDAARRIKIWQDKDGKICTSCEQGIPHTHTEEKIQPLLAERDTAHAEGETVRRTLKKLQDSIEQLATAISEQEPEASVREAEQAVAAVEKLRDTATKWALHAKGIKDEQNPHVATIAKLRGRIDDKIKERDALVEEVERFDVLAKHWSYIYTSYYDRRKIKSYSVAKFRPLLNARLAYYLDKFKLNIDIKITDSLGVDTSDADYDFMAGGERKRVDVAFMLARFDVREELFGKQCNIIVMDEVDSRMDEEGVECLADIVMNDLASRVDAVLVISHKRAMRDYFPRQIVVDKSNKLSMITELR